MILRLPEGCSSPFLVRSFTGRGRGGASFSNPVRRDRNSLVGSRRALPLGPDVRGSSSFKTGGGLIETPRNTLIGSGGAGFFSRQRASDVGTSSSFFLATGGGGREAFFVPCLSACGVDVDANECGGAEPFQRHHQPGPNLGDKTTKAYPLVQALQKMR